jgi:hypothetical protein
MTTSLFYLSITDLWAFTIHQWKFSRAEFGLPSDFGIHIVWNGRKKWPQFSVVAKPKNGVAAGSGAWPNAVVAMRTITTFYQVFKIENCSLAFPACRQGRFVDFTLSSSEIKIYFDWRYVVEQLEGSRRCKCKAFMSVQARINDFAFMNTTLSKWICHE